MNYSNTIELLTIHPGNIRIAPREYQLYLGNTITVLALQLADFGMSHDMDEDYYYKPKGGRIPVKWTAPEAILYRRYTTKSDVWNYGMVMYEIWSLGHKPFEEFSIQEVRSMMFSFVLKVKEALYSL